MSSNINSNNIIQYAQFVPQNQSNPSEFEDSSHCTEFDKLQFINYINKENLHSDRRYSDNIMSPKEPSSAGVKTGYSSSLPPQVYATADFYPQPLTSEASPSSAGYDQQLNHIQTSEDAQHHRYVLQEQELQVIRERQNLQKHQAEESAESSSSNQKSQVFPLSPQSKFQSVNYNYQEEEGHDEQNYDFLSNQHQSYLQRSQNRLFGASHQKEEEENQDEEEEEEEEYTEFQDSLGVQDQDFTENLLLLYGRRQESAKRMLDQLKIEIINQNNTQDHLQNLRAQLQNNKSNAVSQLKIRHHKLVLNLDNLLEQALEEVFSSEGKQLERIEGAMKEVADRLGDVEACTEMVDLKSRAEKKTKFVQYFPDMVKQVEKVMSARKDINVDASVAQLYVPSFDYQIVPSDQLSKDSKASQKGSASKVVLDSTAQPMQHVKSEHASKTQQSTPTSRAPKQLENVSNNENQSQRSNSHLNSQAKQIRKRLRSLKKETDYAKKLIMNEKKLDSLLGVLDRSKESIIRQSVQAFEGDQSMFSDNSKAIYHRGELSTQRSSKPPISGTRFSRYQANGQALQLSEKPIIPLRNKRANSNNSCNTTTQNIPNHCQILGDLDVNSKMDAGRAVHKMPPTPTVLYGNQNQFMLPGHVKLTGRNLDDFSAQGTTSTKRDLSQANQNTGSIKGASQTLNKENQENESYTNDRTHSQQFSVINQNSLSYQNTYAGDYLNRLSYKHQEKGRQSMNISQQRPSKKEKVFKFSHLRQTGEEQFKICDAQLRVYLPNGENQFSTYYDVRLREGKKRRVSDFLYKLLKHLKIQSRDRNRFFVSMQTDQNMERILNKDEDIGRVLSQGVHRPLLLFLKESIYC